MTPEPLFLSTDEVVTLTGFRLPSRQVEWLKRKGWRFELNGNRQPIIARKYAEKMLGCGSSDGPAFAPNFAALQGA